MPGIVEVTRAEEEDDGYNDGGDDDSTCTAIGYWFCARFYSKYSRRFVEFSPHNNPMRQALLLALFYRCGNGCTERTGNGRSGARHLG